MDHDGRLTLSGCVKLILFIGLMGPVNAVCQSLEQHLDAASAKYGLDKQLLRSIASVESQNGLHRLNKRTIDYGVLQINYITAWRYKLNSARLYNDDAYSAEAGARILKDFHKRFGAQPTWPCRWNIGTGSLASPARNKACEKYLLKLKANGYKLAVGGENEL